MQSARKHRFVFMLTDEETQEIQDFRFTNRIGSKAAAVRLLISQGLNSLSNCPPIKQKGPVEAATSPSHEIDPPRKGKTNEQS